MPAAFKPAPCLWETGKVLLAQALMRLQADLSITIQVTLWVKTNAALAESGWKLGILPHARTQCRMRTELPRGARERSTGAFLSFVSYK